MAVAGAAGPLALGAAAVLFGVAASLVFQRFRLPEVVPLLVAGIVLGPWLGLVDPSGLGSFADVFVALALVVILFEGGLDLNIRHLRERLGFTTVLLVTSYVATSFAIGAVARFAVGFSWPIALLFGLALAPLSSSILIPLVGKLKVLPETKALLTVESALGDVLAAVAVLGLVGVLEGRTPGAGGLVLELGGDFLVGAVAGLLLGLLWLVALRFFQGRSYTYMVTFAVAVLLFAAVDLVGASGVVGVLVFALVLGNAERFVPRLPGAVAMEIDARIRWFHGEMSFFVRTFFFLYLGALVTPAAFTSRVLFAAVAVVVAIVAVRALLVGWLVRRRPVERQDRGYLSFLVARGLASAALATVPAVVALTEGTPFRDLAFSVILLTNLAMTAYVVAKEHGFGAGADPERSLVGPEHFAAVDPASSPQR